MKRYRTLITCEQCGKEHQKETYDFKRTKHNFCSKKCKGTYQTINNTIAFYCEICNKKIVKRKSQAERSKSGKHFCSTSCAATYNNKLKRKSRRSKIEAKFYNLLVKEFPQLNIVASDKTMLDGYEVDISIPSLKLAIEWNGIVHFKPIYGQTKLSKIQDRDAEKLVIAANKNINLIVIPDLVSNDRILKQAFSDVRDIINKLI